MQCVLHKTAEPRKGQLQDPEVHQMGWEGGELKLVGTFFSGWVGGLRRKGVGKNLLVQNCFFAQCDNQPLRVLRDCNGGEGFDSCDGK